MVGLSLLIGKGQVGFQSIGIIPGCVQHAARGYMKDWWKRFKEVVDAYDDELEFDIRISEYFET
jgi:hypothetical protein